MEEPGLRNGTVTTTTTTNSHLEDGGEPSDDSSDNEDRKFISPKARLASGLTEKQALLSTTFFFVAATFMCNGVWVQTISGFYKVYNKKCEKFKNNCGVIVSVRMKRIPFCVIIYFPL